jgi:MFS family permease
MTPAFASIIADIVPREKRGRIMSALGQGGFITATTPIVFGSFLSGFIYEWDHVYPWYLYSIALLVALILGILSIHEPAKVEI